MMDQRQKVAKRSEIIFKEKFGELWQHEPKSRGHFQIEQLPDGLVTEILSWLPIKTLLKCRCVCKDWYFIISNPQFSRLHGSRSPIAILTKTCPPKIQSRKLDFTHIVHSAGSDIQVEKITFTSYKIVPVPSFHLINSCNGLLCLCGNDFHAPFYVCNPILGEYITVQSNSKGRNRGGFVGLGFSPGTSEYKVLQTFNRLPPSSTFDQSLEAEIYTIGTGVWRSIGNAPSDLVQLPFDPFLCGALHWLKGSEVIHCFDFEREEFRQMDLPSNVGPVDNCLKLGILGGCLILCVFGNSCYKFDMWVMQQYGVSESWTNVLGINSLFLGLNIEAWREPILVMSGDGKIIMSYNGWDAILGNQKKKSVVSKTRISPSGRTKFLSVAFRPCLVSLSQISKGEEVKRVEGRKKFANIIAARSYDCGTKENQCSQCGGHLDYLFRGKGRRTCLQCFDGGEFFNLLWKGSRNP